MKRPLSIFCLALIAGILVSCLSNSYLIIGLLVVLMSFFGIVTGLKNPKIIYVIIGIIVFCSLGAIEYKFVNDLNTNRFVDYSGEQVVIRGVIDSEPETTETKISYVIRVEEINSNGKSKNTTGKVLLTTLNQGFIYDYGKEIEISGALGIPKGTRNPGGFDYRRYLAQSGISATIFAKQQNIKVTQNSKANFMVKTGLMLRGKIVDVIKNSMPGQQAALLNGMLIGYTEGLSEEVQKAFRDSGLTHIMAVSGANVVFIVVPLIFVLRKILKLRQKTSNLTAVGVLVLFVFVAGFQPSVLRAVIMAIVILVGQILRREADIYTSMSFAAILLLLYSPGMLFNIGFQLSFAATLSLVLLYKNIKSHIDFKFMPDFVADVLAATLAAQIGVLPIAVYYFNNISLISLLTNIIVLPVVEIITVLGSIMAILGQVSVVFSQIIGYINSPLLAFVLYTTRIASSVPYAVIRVTTPSLVMLLAYYILVWFLLWYKPLVKFKIKPKHYAAAFAVIIFITSVSYLAPKKLEVVFIDVGEGDSIFIKTYSGRTILIDGGGFNTRLNPGKSIGDSVIIPFLLDYGVSSLDMVIATHGHDDHIQGLEAVLEGLKVNNLVMPDCAEKKEFGKLLKTATDKGVKTNFCQQGDTIGIDNRTCFKVLFPQKALNIDYSPLNNSSLVLKLIYKDTSILFTGDMEKEVEQKLLSEGIDLEADILKVAHHGSKYTTSSEFLNAVNPKAAIISVGKNTFGHPSPEALERLTKSDARIYRTDECGAVILNSDGNQIKITKTVNDQLKGKT